MDEPKRRRAVVRDSEGWLWTRGTRLWSQPEKNARLPWDALVRHYGPVYVDAETERLEGR